MTTRGTRTLVLGGVRSGKSGVGEALLAEHAEVRYIATGPTLTSDAEWVARVEEHRRRRDERYTTVETTDLTAELSTTPDVATLVDDLGNWLAADIDATNGWESPIDRSDRTEQLCAAISAVTADLVIISPEVGLAPVPSTAVGRAFQDELGALNSAVAAVCDRVLLVVAGRVVELPADFPTPAAQTAQQQRSPQKPAAPDVAPTAAATASAVAITAAATAPKAPDTATAASGSMSESPKVDATDAEVFDHIDRPDESVAQAARDRQLTLTKPAGSLGRLEDLSVWIAACQGECPPRSIEQANVVVFAGDHGVAQAGVSAYPPEVTAQMVANIASGGAAVNVLARQSGATVHVVDMSVDADTPPEVSRYKVRRGSGDLRVTDALTIAEARASIAAGRAIVDDLVDSGADLLIAGEMGIGNTTPAAILVGTLTRHEPVEVVGRGTGIDDLGWMRKTAAIRDGMRRGRRYIHDPLALVAAVGGADIAAMAGFLAQAAVRRTPVILDGVVVTAAALVAAELAPGAVSWWVAGHRSVEPAHTFALEHLDLEPILDLRMRLGEGSGALMALPVVSSSVEILRGMSTFDEAGISDSDSSAALTTSDAGV
ncbi:MULTISPECIES: nicotinate-nucleotide--dimethylbenzimidazole phosphoribosyltransferase [unclassified Gordonia (in: high G+C Gram-positive bacteria)]|uniref:nicotinate-nucleotide--dimethylbenzimidazole phosphoribosyltransferase n=1 Tax=unclassified Gordonia (in: high G+C Gram-positive bacteria) TaxID=2657482 RepID=UPI0007EB4253|nr:MULTISPECIES: nicotinate-nucleotide--dimethylbenzimidazole phosphoribosyltransferase [unclassified Gordonia (in: high G+C Gram-positive bacteria)]OBC10085.1 nicotinate-nucleotide--dimethylbenzimidazole phosphoribosyltransferase [Gordonia sp. 852002-50395_SCH5434458]OBC18076.1 nicotinate-nucleotide--dimethylbenzimidazole phosphoribosyltransferase [Gordonia sp. 852002-50816_SCH5313054-a]OBC20895.1 nicotinate-nucleotide--dimethylbenzimidazole phosphoribosyltransferase [Gordonia sp. 852002-50816_